MLVAKFLFSIISFGSGAPGGIFFPLLIIGGTFGAVFGYIAIKMCIRDRYGTCHIFEPLSSYFFIPLFIASWCEPENAVNTKFPA